MKKIGLKSKTQCYSLHTASFTDDVFQMRTKVTTCFTYLTYLTYFTYFTYEISS